MSSEEKVRERKARRALDRRGMTLKKCAARDKAAINYGLYQVLRLGRAVKLWNEDKGTWNTLDTVLLWLEMSAERKEA